MWTPLASSFSTSARARRSEAHTGHDEPAGADDHDHAGAHDAKDAHIWLDPENAKAIVAHVAKTLAGLDAANAATYTANAAHMTANIDTLSAEIAATLKPVSGKPFVVFHDAYQYFEKRFGLAARGSVTVSPDVPPSARRLTDVRNRFLNWGRFAFLQSRCSSRNLLLP